MLKLIDIKKSYTTGDFTQIALNKVSLDFRKNEFVTILGPSGCGKTTLLNIVGGLDHYDDGDLIISGKSTKDFGDNDWDMYRNNSIGFIFQSHNLIPHLSILQNVEMGLALSGVSAKERHDRAVEVLIEVGLKDHLHKRPNQLSGGQSQRVAIARALANNPDVILADEPTGSLDSVTSVAILELIRKIAKDKLVIMVTHNTELAEKYATRIIRLKDGVVIGDTNPFVEGTLEKDELVLKKTAMSFKTAVISSFNNIKTKLGRTLLTAFAGSIGIIGIALILSLSNGLDQEINNFERETLAGYPISITESRIDFEKMRQMDTEELDDFPDTDFATAYDESRLAQYFATNIITETYVNYVRNYVEILSPDTISGVKYVQRVNMSLLKGFDTELGTFYAELYKDTVIPEEGGSGMSGFAGLMSFFTLLPEGEVLTDNYDLIYGSFPINTPNTGDFQVLLVVDEYNRIYKSTLMGLGFDTVNTTEFAFEDLVNTELKLFVGEYNMLTSDVTTALNVQISGIVRIKDGSNVTLFRNGLGYTTELLDYITTTYPEEIGPVSNIYIYPDDFDAKEDLKVYLDAYNDSLATVDKVEYVDQAATFTSMVKGVIDTISIVLIAFAAISLVVSSIMIGIITYISVIERTKEIGVLRALGARKKDISRVFNTENLLIGFVAGAVGVGVSLLLIIPINLIIAKLAEMANVAELAPLHALLLIVISVVLALIAGLIPAQMAAKKDPVEALRTE